MTILQRIFGIWYWLCGANQENSASVDKNYTVHQLWPEDKENVEPNSNTLTLIFFHGLQLKDGKSPWRTTWKARDTDECWPQKWLPEDLREKGIQNVRVLSLSYDSIASRWFGRGRTKDVSDIGQYLVDNLICSSKWRLYEHQRIVLVGHSFGGLVIKSMIAAADKRVMRRTAVQSSNAAERQLTERQFSERDFTERMNSQCREFLKHIRHIIFYAVPQLGSEIAKYVELVDRIVNLRLAGIMHNLQPFQKKMKDLSDEFEFATDKEYHIPIYAIAETPTSMMVKSLPKQQ
ncbi:unnamed protein product [Sphagnum balticum]